MADPNSSVPNNYDPYNSPINYDYFGLMNDSNPTLANLSSSTNDPAASLNPFGDPITAGIPSNLIFNIESLAWDQNNVNVPNFNTTTHQQAGPSGHGGGGGRERVESHPHQQQQRHSFIDDSRPLPVWPPEPVSFQCSCCQVLREIIHSDVTGKCVTKLEIHGRLGIISHAILEIKDRVSLVPSPSEFRMIDFCKKSMDNVKAYLEEYCNEQKRAGLVIVQDPLSTFYEALCVGITQLPENVNNNEEEPVLQGEVIRLAEAEGERAARRNLAQQRERAGRLTLRDFNDYFHMPIEEAARRMNLCPSVVKKICRRDGMLRWPYRKIKSLQRQIGNLRSLLSSNDAEERAAAETEIHRLEQEIANLCAGGDDGGGGGGGDDGGGGGGGDN